MDRGAWWAAVHGVPKSQRRLRSPLTECPAPGSVLPASLVSWAYCPVALWGFAPRPSLHRAGPGAVEGQNLAVALSFQENPGRGLQRLHPPCSMAFLNPCESFQAAHDAALLPGVAGPEEPYLSTMSLPHLERQLRAVLAGITPTRPLPSHQLYCRSRASYDHFITYRI